MTTTVTAADAVIKLTVALTLGGKTFDIEFTQTVSLCTRADRNIVPVRVATEQEIVELFAGAGDLEKGSFSSFDGFFIMNRDDTNFVRIRISQDAGDTVDYRLDPGEFMILWNEKIEVNTTEAAFGAFVNFDTVSMQADTAVVDVEYLAIKI